LYGHILENDIFLGVNTVFIVISSIIVIFLIYIFLSKKLSIVVNEELTYNRSHAIRFFFIDSIIIFVSWIPVFLALYPGLFAYDVMSQIPQTYGSYSTHHPLIHTLFLQFFYKNFISENGSHNLGMAISVLIQMAILAMSQAFILWYGYRRKITLPMRIFNLIFVCIMPIYSVLSVSMTKDILFTAFFDIFVVCACLVEYDDVSDSSIFISIMLIISGTLSALFRNNGKYVVYVYIFYSLIKILRNILVSKKMGQKIIDNSVGKMTGRVMLLIIVPIIAENILISSTAATRGGINEAMSVPYQQIARVYNYAVMDADDIDVIKILIPNIDGYNETISDSVKNTAHAFKNAESTKQFIYIYFKYLIKYPKIYIDAFLHTNMGFWYIDDVTHAQMYGKRADGTIADDYGYFLMDTKSGFGVEHISKFPLLDTLIKKLFHENMYQQIPIVSKLFSLGLYAWIIFGLFIYCLEKRIKKLLPFLLVGMLYLTILFGPCALVRYAFPYITAVPIILYCMISGINK